MVRKSWIVFQINPCWVAAGAAAAESCCSAWGTEAISWLAVDDAVCADCPAGVALAWATAADWPPAASGLVVLGGSMNWLSSVASADEPA